MVKINGSEVNVIDNVVITNDLTEERDNGQITILSDRANRYEPFDVVDIIDYTTTDQQFLIQSDTVTKLQSGLYEHRVVLIEPMAKFDSVFPADRSFTRVPARTLEEVLTVYKNELGGYHNIDIDWEDGDYLATELPNKEFVGVNFSIVLFDLFRIIDATPRVEYHSGTKVWTIRPQFYSFRNNEITETNVVSELNRVDLGDYATNIKTKVKNATFEELEAVWFPSENGYVLPKSSTPQMRDSTLQYELDSEIVEIVEVKAIGITATSFPFIFLGQTEQYTVTNVDVDITDNVLTTEEYRTIPTLAGNPPTVQTIQESLNTRNAIQYDIGGRTINTLYQAGTDTFVFFSSDTFYLKNAIAYGLRNQYWYVTTPVHWDITTIAQTEDIKIRVKYIRRRNLDVTHFRQLNGSMNPTTQIQGQRDSSINMSRYLDQLKTMANRFGNVMITRTKTFQRGETLYEIGDYVGNQTITKVQYTFDAKQVFCEYMLVENFANLQAEYALSREPSPFTITKKTIQTNLIINEFIELGFANKSDTSRLRTNPKRVFINTFSNATTPGNKLKHAIIVPLIEASSPSRINGIHMPVFSGAGGNTMLFHVAFNDPYKAGDTWTNTSGGYRFATPIPYTWTTEPGKYFGELEQFRFFFFSYDFIQDGGSYPLNTITLSDLQNIASTDSTVTDTIDLDVNAALGITYQLHCVSSTSEIVIGKGLASENFLMRDIQTGVIKIYSSTKPFTMFDTDIRSGDTDVTSSMSLTVNNLSYYVRVIPSIPIEHFAIYRDGKMMFAVNKSISSGTTTTIYFNFLKEL